MLLCISHVDHPEHLHSLPKIIFCSKCIKIQRMLKYGSLLRKLLQSEICSILIISLHFCLPNKFQSYKNYTKHYLKCHKTPSNYRSDFFFLKYHLELKSGLSRFIFKFILVIYHSSFQTWPLVNKASTHMV